MGQVTPHQFWRSIDELMGRRNTRCHWLLTPIRFTDSTVHTSTVDTDTFSTVPLRYALRNFRPLAVIDDITAVTLLPDSSARQILCLPASWSNASTNWRRLWSNRSIFRYNKASFLLYLKQYLGSQKMNLGPFVGVYLNLWPTVYIADIMLAPS